MSRAPVRGRSGGRRFVVVLAAATVLGAWAGPAADALGGDDGIEPVARTSYVVRDGDTLWSIATGLVPGEDPRPVVDEIAATNGLDAGALVPGQTLVIPAGG